MLSRRLQIVFCEPTRILRGDFNTFDSVTTKMPRQYEYRANNHILKRRHPKVFAKGHFESMKNFVLVKKYQKVTPTLFFIYNTISNNGRKKEILHGLNMRLSKYLAVLTLQIGVIGGYLYFSGI